MERGLGHAEGRQHRGQQRRDGWFADPAEAEGGHGDAELAAGEIGLDIAQHVLGELRPEAVLGGEPVDPEAARLHQRELGGDEEGVGGKQKDGEKQAEGSVAHRRVRRPARLIVASSPRGRTAPSRGERRWR